MRTCWWISPLSETGSSSCARASSLIPLPMARSSGGRLPGRPAGRALHQPEECATSLFPHDGGHDQALRLAHEVQSRSSYTSIIATPDLLIELFDCDADGYPMEGMWIQKVSEQGQIYDLTVMLRPYPAVTVLRNMAKELAEKRGVLGKEYWELPASSCADEKGSSTVAP